MGLLKRFKKYFFRFDLQGRLVAGFLVATCLTGSIAAITNIWTINRSTIAEVQNRVGQDINAAQLIYNSTLDQMATQIQFAVEAYDLYEYISRPDRRVLENLGVLVGNKAGPLQIVNRQEDYPESHSGLDMLTLADAGGKVIYRAGNPGRRGDSLMWDPVVMNCLTGGIPVSSTELVPIEKILIENPDLSGRVGIEIVKTPLSAEIGEKRLSDCMVMKAAYPILDKHNVVVGVLVGGILLNGDSTIVDKIKATVYRGEKYKGRDMGVATIFQGGVRIATNVMMSDGRRAVGTTISKTVYDRVIKEGKDWAGRAFVVNDWFITTYKPIYNMDRRLIGVLYTGLLEAKYRDIRWRTIWTNMIIMGIGMILAFVFAYYFGKTIITRIGMLKEASEEIASGNLDYKLSPDRVSGFDMLDKAFNNMAISLKERDDRLQQLHQHLARTDRLTALGGIAAGVAHEINNPLGGILLYSNLVLEDIPGDGPARENIKKIIYQTDRCKKIVQNLLDFARTPTGEMIALQINNIIKTSLNLVEDQSMFHGIEVETRLADNLPDVVGDPSRLEEVFLNLFINAADAMNGKGKLTITSQSGGGDVVRIRVSDTGKGIEREHLPHIFEPFFTTKEPGKGTGLGLSIAYGVISKHNGVIDAESEPGKGTTFIITLPGVDLGYDAEGKKV